MKTVLVTGGAGFIGSNFVPYWVEKYPDYMIINLDKLTYAGNLANLKECEGAPNYRFVRGDICDAELAARLFKEHDIRGVVHFAAESHVDNSISGPRAFIETNLVGTFTLLDAARNHGWKDRTKQNPDTGTAASIIFRPTKFTALWAKPAFSAKPRPMIRVRRIPPPRPGRICWRAPITALSA